MTHSTRVQMKIGDAEFIAEGSEESVNRQYQLFLNALAARGAAPAAAPMSDDPPPPPPPPPGNGANGATVPATILHHAFITNANGISLRALPTTDDSVTDTILMLLYGYRVLNERLDVSAGDLTEAVRASGIQTTRIDRIIGRSTLIRRAGSKRGTRYSLNNLGITRAQTLLREMYA